MLKLIVREKWIGKNMGGVNFRYEKRGKSLVRNSDRKWEVGKRFVCKISCNYF